MGKLEDLEKKLYGGGDDLKKRMQRRVMFPASFKRLSFAWREPAAQEPALDPAQAEKNKKLMKWFLWSFAGVFILIAGTVAFLYFGTKGQEARVVINDRGPIEAGELVTIPISFQNVSQTILEEVELTVILPENSLVDDRGFERPAPPRIIKKIGSLQPGEEGVHEIATRMFGREGEKKEVQAILLYRPQNLRARFSSKSVKELVIRRVPLAITWEIPETLSKGQDVTARVRYTSTSPRVFQNLWMRVEYPPGFSFSSAEPKPAIGNNLWNLGSLDPGKEGSIVVSGVMNAEEGEIKAFRGELGIFNELTKEWLEYQDSSSQVKIAVTPLSAQGFFKGAREGVVHPGDSLGFTIRYKNNTVSTLRNITVRAFLEGDLVDFNSFSIDHGVFDLPSQAVVWNSGSAQELGELLPGQSGELRFSVRTRERPAVRSARDKNMVVRLRTEIAPGLIPSELEGTDLRAKDLISLKVKSKVIFSGKSLYRASPLINSGPLPPRVGQKTMYALLFEIRNFTNDLRDALVTLKLPPNVKWENSFAPAGSRVAFDAGSGEVRWNIGEVKAGVGVVTPVLTLAFQVSITPSGNDVGKSPDLAFDLKFSAFDGFANEATEERLEPLSTELKEDPSSDAKTWTVVP